jgi:signal transduction histidine kinase
MIDHEKAIRLFLVNGEPAGARDVQQALERQGLQSEVEVLPHEETAQPADHTVVELDRLRGLLLENQKLVTTGRLAASIAHEINNPLEAVTNLLYLLTMESGLTPQGRTFLNMAQSELMRVAQISKHALQFNRETTNPVRIEPCGLIEEVVALYSRRAHEKGIHIKREYQTEDPITAFPGEIRQVFSNLMANAIEATAGGGRIRVRVRAARLWIDPARQGVRITIGDTGSGIPTHVRRRLGEPFYTTKGQKGTGIGLWLSQTILQRYGGNLQLWSSTAEHHHGTVFTIFLPANLRPAIVENPRRDVA